ncbi:hypothetical protein [Elizabethkingia miricola]|uniref:hypothetical protein n=1 Tax=Elizabethkingia miricola TaxID=172045 RepID=UPI0015943635|nr:hypothetical protein [Elizabethkingia miricola]UIO96444.1 hypothetical protein LYZ41_19865 [Elizabethkingia miricola]WER13229.1 hypothetical protein P0M31_19605 [Elizabethkingia miricola]WGL73404.1 hypothetical protein QFB80_19545 [Elizabethkingia miricola]WNG65130.1 hypothetical protein M9H57_19540 [Elizabethkingia miricola]
MKKKILFAPLWGVFALSLLSSCRTEDGLTQKQQEKDLRFSVFVQKNGKPINYADGFAFLMKRYDGVQKTNLSGVNNKPIIGTIANADKTTSVTQDGQSYVEFNIKSQIITEENGDKWIVFPKVQGNRVIGLVSASLTEKGTYVRYHNYNEQDELYKLNVVEFQESLNKFQRKFKTLALSASINPIAGLGCRKEDGEWVDCSIPDVIITVPKPNPGTTNPSGPGGGGGGCQEHANCIDPNGGGGGAGESLQDLCGKASAASKKATENYKNAAVQSAKEATQNAYNNDPTDAKKEHTTMIENSNGQLSKGKTFDGNAGNVTGEATSSTVGDIHNHNEDIPPSPGDVYGLIEMAESFQNYRTKYIYTQQGTEYALIVTDIDALKSFLKMYPPERRSDSNRVFTNFPGNLKTEWQDISTNDGYSNASKTSLEIATAYILDKYNAGVAITKKNNTGNFNKIGAVRLDSGYNQTNCNN